MKKWETEILRSDLAETIKREYRNLLSVKKSGEDAETILLNHFKELIESDDAIAGRFWMALGLCEWQAGRLTRKAKENAQYWATKQWESIPPSALRSLSATMDAPMPPRKNIRLPAYVSHCPWPVGSLLAYRIISSKHPHVMKSLFYGKYVLLRIIQIKRNPITQLAPNDGWDERMLVGLYDWIGDSIPSPQIVEGLNFTPIAIIKSEFGPSLFHRLQTQALSAQGDVMLQETINRLTATRIETCCDLDWKCAKGINPKDVFTYLGCDPSYGDGVDPFFKTGITEYAMCHSLPFDGVLVNRFSQLSQDEPSVIADV